jgi:hypothetical protein
MKGLEYDRGRAMKQTDFKPCVKCGKGVAHTGIPLFYRVTIERMGIDGQAVRQHAGLEQMIGNARIAHAMGADADIGIPIGEAEKGLICSECAHGMDLDFAHLSVLISKAGERR